VSRLRRLRQGALCIAVCVTVTFAIVIPIRTGIGLPIFERFVFRSPMHPLTLMHLHLAKTKRNSEAPADRSGATAPLAGRAAASVSF
jgi:hypothetical protein